ncbi:S24 family peptidase [Microvirga flavescens]|uniref:S24 family peptidase n=1 Tax=Microvirga flavescens TaxID=2249811 RepID=UPI000DDA6975|nr:helix-turn-helix transcriptional regulator [Microvirga flavescens]
MLSHDRVWAAIDALAARHGMTASGLARKAGLDATSFNKSKRTSPEGRDRWPSTESISKILHATGASLEDFIRLVEPGGATRGAFLPLTKLELAAKGDLFTEDGLPKNGPAWEEINFPGFAGDNVFALEVSGDSFGPLFRDGDIIIVSPTASMRKGDRVIVRTKAGEIIAKELRRRTPKTLELASLGSGQEETPLPLEDVSWVARVMWSRH